MKTKKAIFFSGDALIALMIIMLVLIIAVPRTYNPSTRTSIHSDTMKVLSNLKVGEIDNTQIKALIASGDIEDLNKSILEQIGEFYVTDKNFARATANEILSYLDTDRNIGIWYEKELIASKNSTPIENARNIEVERQIISGIQEGNETTGYSARAYLSSDVQTEYFYFGGYVGDGNISANIEYEGNITGARIEIATNKNFSVYINNNYSGYYESSTSNIIPAQYDISSYLSNFQNGSNTIEFVGEEMRITGGYIRIEYTGFAEETTKQYLPGISGLINIYDGFYTKNLQTLAVSLHLDSPYEIFLTIGNKTIFENSTSGEETITITNAEISSIINYNEIANKTVPIRIGISNASYVINETRYVDAFSVTDLSGSMCDCSQSGWFSTCKYNEERCGTHWSCSSGVCTEGINEAREANDAFIDGILNASGNQVGLAGYEYNADLTEYHQLSTDNVSLKAEVASWLAYGGTCICCGINRGISGFSGSSSEKMKVMIVMSDGAANYGCSNFNDFTGSSSGSAAQDAIDSACEAYQNHGITVHAIGFGSGAEETTLQAIAACGNGSYYAGNISNIVALYQQISEEILNASYYEQTISASGSFAPAILYPDSYIEIGQTSSEEPPRGLILTVEEQFDNASAGTFDIPSDAAIISAEAISYSGPRWTAETWLNGNNIYQISDYGSKYIDLGDPYAISIPKTLIQTNNTVEIKTATTSMNTTEGSAYNKIIYKIQKNSSSYSTICPIIDGCSWTIEFEDNTNITIDVPATYNGSAKCYYTSASQSYDPNDALQEATYKLLQILDLDSNNKIDSKFSENNLQITPTEIKGIPFTWSTEVQIRIWD